MLPSCSASALAASCCRRAMRALASCRSCQPLSFRTCIVLLIAHLLDLGTHVYIYSCRADTKVIRWWHRSVHCKFLAQL